MSASYRIPSLLEEMISWEKEIAAEVPYLETPTGYFLQFKENENGGYRCSPLDSIMFAGTGMDGIHFSLLTNFGSITDLQEAPVICVSPMDFGNCVRVVANNIYDFFHLSLMGYGSLIMNDYASKEDYIKHSQEQEQREDKDYFNEDKWYEQQMIVRSLAIRQFGFQPIKDPYELMMSARSKHAESILLPTADGLGVPAALFAEGKGGTVVDAISTTQMNEIATHPWANEEIPMQEADQVLEYVKTAPLPALLAFTRDCQQQYIDDPRLISLLHDKLEQKGFKLEAIRLLHCM